MMDDFSSSLRYIPRRKKGTIVLSSLLAITLGLSLTCFWLSSKMTENWMFGLFLALGIIFLLPIPMLTYRLMALARAYYEISRNYLTIHWGLRTELIPIPELEWIRPVSDLIDPLPLPTITLPGALIGIRDVEGLGKVEFLADGIQNALLAATAHMVYVISPLNAREFTSVYKRCVELGSIENTKSQSIKPAFLLGKLWDSKVMRILFLSGFLVNSAAVIWTILIITSRQTVTFGYSAISIVEPAPSIRLLILPTLSVIILLMDTIAGAFFYRSEDQRPLAYLLYAGSSVTGLLFLIALYLVTITP